MLLVSTSQPSVYVALQSRNVPLHALMTHALPAQPGVAFGTAAHALVQEPQWFRSVVVSKHASEQHVCVAVQRPHGPASVPISTGGTYASLPTSLPMSGTFMSGMPMSGTFMSGAFVSGRFMSGPVSLGPVSRPESMGASNPPTSISPASLLLVAPITVRASEQAGTSTRASATKPKRYGMKS